MSVRRPRLMFLAAALTAAGVAAILTARPRQVRVSLADGGDARIVSVIVSSNHVVSFEPGWKQFTRKVLPDAWEKPLGPFQGSTNRTQHESLLIGLEVRDAAGQPAPLRPLRRPLVLFDPGFSSAGDLLFLSRTGCAYIRFDVYPRERPELNIRLNYRDEVIQFTVNNPRPATAAKWQGLSLPQTNRTPHLQVVLQPNGPPQALGASDQFFNQSAIIEATAAAGSPPAGWRRAMFSTLDAQGNWTSLRAATHGRFLDLTLVDSPLKVQVQVEEYVSAGFVPTDPTTDWLPLPVDPRARELGFHAAAIVPAGKHRITSDSAFKKLGRTSSAPHLALTGSSETNWTITLNTSTRGILVVTEATTPGIRFQARLRERLKPDGGRTFTHRLALAASNSFNGKPYTAAFFTHVNARTIARGPGLSSQDIDSTETKLEAELITLHPATDFLITLGN